MSSLFWPHENVDVGENAPYLAGKPSSILGCAFDKKVRYASLIQNINCFGGFPQR